MWMVSSSENYVSLFYNKKENAIKGAKELYKHLMENEFGSIEYYEKYCNCSIEDDYRNIEKIKKYYHDDWITIQEIMTED